MRTLRIISAIILIATVLSLTAYANEREGLGFAVDTVYRVEDIYDESPNTFEAWIKIDASVTGRAGVIIGNYRGERYKPDVNFEIHENGNPRLYMTQTGTYGNYIFKNVHVNTGEWLHLAITRDPGARKVYCYVNGELKQTLNDTYAGEPQVTVPMGVGGDLRDGNTQYFKGEISSIAVYSGTRGAQDIAADMTEYGTDGLIASYELKDIKNGVIADKSPNGYDIVYKATWIPEEERVAPGDYAYSFAVVGDTQVVAERHKDRFGDIYKWILDNAEERNTKFVFGLGDITETSSDAEWEVAMDAIKAMDGRIPYSLVRGNHDHSSDFKQYVSYGAYKDTIGGSYGKDMLNTYRELTVGELKYLIFTLDFGPSDKVLDWADGIIAAHPHHNVIITTHAYLFRDGTTLDDGDVVPPSKNGGVNDGDDMWEKLIKHHENIVLVMSGHDISDNIIMTQVKGEHGNTVTQMLIDPQGADVTHGGVGAVAMLYFSEDGREVSVEYYSTLKEKYFMSDSQFTMTLDVVEPSTSNGGSSQGNNNKPAGTQKPTETPTDAPSAEAPTESATEQYTETLLAGKRGCGSYVSASAVCVIGVGAALLCMRERKRRRG